MLQLFEIDYITNNKDDHYFLSVQPTSLHAAIAYVCGLLAMYYYKAEKTVLSVFENCTLQLIRVDLQAIMWKGEKQGSV